MVPAAELLGRLRFGGPFFNEFVLEIPDARRRWQRASEQGVLAGFPLAVWYPELKQSLLLCATEVHDEQALTTLVDALGAPTCCSSIFTRRSRPRMAVAGPARVPWPCPRAEPGLVTQAPHGTFIARLDETRVARRPILRYRKPN